MVRIMKFFSYSVFFIIMLMYFMPKISTYYLLEEKLKEYSIVISQEEVVENAFSLDIKDAYLSVKSIQSAKIKDINIKIFFFYNKISINDVVLNQGLNTYIPLHIEHININYSIFNPLVLTLDGVGELGEFIVVYNINEHSIKLQVKPSNLMLNDYKETLVDFVISENGEYIYEKNI